MPLVLIGLALVAAVVVLPGWWVKRVMRRYHEPADRYDGTGSAWTRCRSNGPTRAITTTPKRAWSG